jgi:hypothetical protein
MRRRQPKQRISSPAAKALAVRSGSFSGHHSNRAYDVKRGHSRKAKHKGKAA